MKMQRKQIPFEEVYDLFAIRIVFKPLPFPSEKTQCYQIYATITDIYTPKPDRLRDWINTPKANGYEALHSTVMSPDGVWVEVQIRTQRMDDIAERGVAAHWKYKQETISQNEDELDKWLKKIRDALNSPTENAVDFLDNFKPVALHLRNRRLHTERRASPAALRRHGARFRLRHPHQRRQQGDRREDQP